MYVHAWAEIYPGWYNEMNEINAGAHFKCECQSC